MWLPEKHIQSNPAKDFFLFSKITFFDTFLWEISLKKDMLSPVAIAMLLGILSTVLLHLSKAMERHGIEVFDQIRAKLSTDTENSSEVEGGAKKPTIYLVGLVINNLTPIWMIIAARYAAPSYFTSMFGLGLIGLMFYSSKILHEPIEKIEYYGAGILIIGTLILGIEGILRPELDVSTIDTGKVWLILVLFLLIGSVCVALAYKNGKPMVVGIIFGLFAGGGACFDPILKAIGQNLGGTAGFLPSTPAGWWIFVISFLFGIIGFGFTQWGFAKDARASTLVPAYNSIYVVLPIAIMALALPGFEITSYTILGMAFVVVGIVLMQAFKKKQPHTHSK